MHDGTASSVVPLFPAMTDDADLAAFGPLPQVLEKCGARSCLSHLDAARLLGIEIVDDPGTRYVTVPRNRSRLRVPGWTVVRSDVSEADLVQDEGLRLTGVVRTLADLARVLPPAEALACADSAVRLGLASPHSVVSRLTGTLGHGAAGIRHVGRLLDPRSGSVLESLLRHLLLEAGLPRPLTQYLVTDENGIEVARVDFAWPRQRLVVEADGYAFHSDRASYRNDRLRANALTQLGWRLLRFTWEDVRQRPDHVVGLVRGCLAASAAAA